MGGGKGRGLGSYFTVIIHTGPQRLMPWVVPGGLATGVDGIRLGFIHVYLVLQEFRMLELEGHGHVHHE